ncbi:MAG: SufD family Fe-S cluster assembly protein [Bacilli bacterium]|nr:SufD family Fe-S cluster assembly protein [Bacilli bacterium]
MEKIIKIVGENKEIEMSELTDLNLSLFDGATLTLKLLKLDDSKDIKISAKVGQNSHLVVFFADFSKRDILLKSDIHLIEENASCEWHLASLSSATSIKHFDVSFYHNVGSTKALMDNYGVARDKSKIVFSGVNHIKNGSKKSITNQVAKIIVFDKDSIGVASPILRIDENDVSASHSASVGQLNSDHMFYLMSRGLNKNEARELITRGYLQPISEKFSIENKSKIEIAIKEAL